MHDFRVRIRLFLMRRFFELGPIPLTKLLYPGYAFSQLHMRDGPLIPTNDARISIPPYTPNKSLNHPPLASEEAPLFFRRTLRCIAGARECLSRSGSSEFGMRSSEFGIYSTRERPVGFGRLTQPRPWFFCSPLNSVLSNTDKSDSVRWRFHRPLVIIDLLMEMSNRSKRSTSRVIRPGDKAEDDPGWKTATVEERINAVWDLTLLCLGWQGDQVDEPRLQRSVSRVQRSRR